MNKISATLPPKKCHGHEAETESLVHYISSGIRKQLGNWFKVPCSSETDSLFGVVSFLDPKINFLKCLNSDKVIGHFFTFSSQQL